MWSSPPTFRRIPQGRASQSPVSLKPRGMPDMKILPPVSIEARRVLPSRWDVLAAALVLGLIVLFADASRSLVQPLATLTHAPISLDPPHLPAYAMPTGFLMLIALGLSPV